MLSANQQPGCDRQIFPDPDRTKNKQFVRALCIYTHLMMLRMQNISDMTRECRKHVEVNEWNLNAADADMYHFDVCVDRVLGEDDYDYDEEEEEEDGEDDDGEEEEEDED